MHGIGALGHVRGAGPAGRSLDRSARNRSNHARACGWRRSSSGAAALRPTPSESSTACSSAFARPAPVRHRDQEHVGHPARTRRSTGTSPGPTRPGTRSTATGSRTPSRSATGVRSSGATGHRPGAMTGTFPQPRAAGSRHGRFPATPRPCRRRPPLRAGDGRDRVRSLAVEETWRSARFEEFRSPRVAANAVADALSLSGNARRLDRPVRWPGLHAAPGRGWRTRRSAGGCGPARVCTSNRAAFGFLTMQDSRVFLARPGADAADPARGTSSNGSVTGGTSSSAVARTRTIAAAARVPDDSYIRTRATGRSSGERARVRPSRTGLQASDRPQAYPVSRPGTCPDRIVRLERRAVGA